MPSTSIYALLQHPNVKSSLAERYIRFIEFCACDAAEYTENHHVLPASIYPEFSNLSKNKWNCKQLIARQHFIAHCMLARVFNKNTAEFFSMVKAFNMMGSLSKTHKGNRYINSRLYEQNRKHMSTTMRDIQLKITNPHRGSVWVTSPCLQHRCKVSGLLINEYYAQGWFISRAKIPYRNSNPTCIRCNEQFTSKSTTVIVCRRCQIKNINVTINSNKRPVIDDAGILYPSLLDAGVAKSLTSEAIRYRIKIGKYRYA